MGTDARVKFCKLAAMAGLLALSACTKPPPPAPPPPPPPPPAPVVHVDPIPYRPLPPAGASYAMDIPPVVNGVRTTMNSGLTPDETAWHLRSAWNVAALNCLGEGYGPVLDGYKWFLTKYKKPLATVNASIEKKFRTDNGSATIGLKARQAHMTQLYNYFAMPAALPDMCRAALEVTADASQAPNRDLATFAAANLPRFEAAYLKFFDAYDQYRVASSDWDAKYGAQYGASQPGWVAIHRGGQTGVAAGLTGVQGSALVGTVADPETGAQIPIVKPPEQTVSVPLVQPVQQNKQ